LEVFLNTKNIPQIKTAVFCILLFGVAEPYHFDIAPLDYTVLLHVDAASTPAREIMRLFGAPAPQNYFYSVNEYQMHTKH
jgi:hypothetical protein